MFLLLFLICNLSLITGHIHICDALSVGHFLLYIFPLSIGHLPINYFMLFVIIKEDGSSCSRW